ncbi:hypothetical protein BHE74_00042372 [Ensete ventricosum]|nr:hypothetical protein BHE74_00042372 [Ensete ventricosum]
MPTICPHRPLPRRATRITELGPHRPFAGPTVRRPAGAFAPAVKYEGAAVVPPSILRPPRMDGRDESVDLSRAADAAGCERVGRLIWLEHVM